MKPCTVMYCNQIFYGVLRDDGTIAFVQNGKTKYCNAANWPYKLI